MTENSNQKNSVRALKSHPEDSVAVVLDYVASGQTVLVTGPGGTREITAQEDIPGFHKIALHDFDKGTVLTRSAIAIGRATSPIRAGELVHAHNLVSLYS